MKKLLLLVPALLLALSGCATTKGGAAFSEAKVEPGQALVYVYRQDEVNGDFVPYVWVAGGRSFDLPNRRYAAFSVPPGKHLIKATWEKRSSLADAETTLAAEANQTYYVRVLSETYDAALGKAVVFYMSNTTAVKVVPREEAMKALPQTKSAL